MENKLDMTTLTAQIYDALHNVFDPELGINIVDLGLVYDIAIRDDGFVTLTMTLTTPGCPMHESIGEGVGAALGTVPGLTGGAIQIVWEPRWEPSMMTEAGRAALGYW
ncbi:MAG: metal-sulfur cluster assembly factor [Ktedonobacterales bacterium]